MMQMWETGHTWNFLKYLKILPVFDYCNTERGWYWKGMTRETVIKIKLFCIYKFKICLRWIDEGILIKSPVRMKDIKSS